VVVKQEIASPTSERKQGPAVEQVKSCFTIFWIGPNDRAFATIKIRQRQEETPLGQIEFGNLFLVRKLPLVCVLHPGYMMYVASLDGV